MEGYTEDDVEYLLPDPSEEYLGHHAYLDSLVKVEEVPHFSHLHLFDERGIGGKRIFGTQLFVFQCI